MPASLSTGRSDLYRRCLRALRASESLLRKPHDNAGAHRALERLHRILEPVRSELPFQRPARTLERRARLHDELRAALRLRPKSPASLAAPADAKAQRLELRDVEQGRHGLHARACQATSRTRPRPGRAPSHRLGARAPRLGPSLWGHVVDLPRNLGGGFALVEHTNVIPEDSWHEIKHGERRRSGRKKLADDFERFRPRPSSPRTSPAPTTSPSSAAASTTSPRVRRPRRRRAIQVAASQPPGRRITSG